MDEDAEVASRPVLNGFRVEELRDVFRVREALMELVGWVAPHALASRLGLSSLRVRQALALLRERNEEALRERGGYAQHNGKRASGSRWRWSPSSSFSEIVHERDVLALATKNATEAIKS